MKFTRFVPVELVETVNTERPSRDLRVFLTRELRRVVTSGLDEPSSPIVLARMNRIVNFARTILSLPIYVLEADRDGEHDLSDYTWNRGEFELVFRRLDAVQLCELVGELIEDHAFDIRFINELFARDGLSFKFIAEGSRIFVEVLPLEMVKKLAESESQWHDNIRLLVARMEALNAASDFSGVLHASASIFETLAKQVVGLPSVQDQTLGSFFARYKSDSGLPEPIVDFVHELYRRRGATSLAGHGSLAAPLSLSQTEARTLIEMTKAFVNIEYKLSLGLSGGNPA